MPKSPNSALNPAVAITIMRQFSRIRGRGWLSRAIARAAFMCIALLMFAPRAHAVEVVVNSSVSQTEISKHALRAIFGMRLREWPDGSPVTVFVLSPDDARHTEFCEKVLYVLPRKLESNWNQLVFSGTGQRPVAVATEEEMRRVVANTPGAIGYLNLDAPAEGHVRKLEIRR